jgi:EAL domain-containing protein (putative c-di-GMP-specific phosphodiesterase class I)
LEYGRFEVHYQPKVKVPENQIVGIEALVRLRQVDGALVSPAEFIPLAEETGLIIPIGDFVLRRACSDARIWHARGFAGKVCVNISAVQFAQKNFSEIVQHVLIETGIQPRLLELEITEGVLMQDFDASRSTLDALAALGISLAIDDFGTGYSSLAYLKRFPVHVLKIDQSFVRDMLVDKSDSAIIAAIINLGRSLGIDLVAEGVETAEQADALLTMGCNILQGYHYSRPIPFGAMTDFIARGAQLTP